MGVSNHIPENALPGCSQPKVRSLARIYGRMNV